MVIYIGGAFQGKLALAQKEHPEAVVCDGKMPEDTMEGASYLLYHFHTLIGTKLKKGVSVEQIVEEVNALKGQLILVCDEVGSGVVPMEKEMRKYREGVGRVMTLLCKKANRVVRVVCGVGTVIKQSRKVILLRHGATQGNTEKRYVGRCDEPLSDAGISELQNNKNAGVYDEIYECIKHTKYKVFGSPMIRCRQTARFLFETEAYVEVEEFREKDFGAYEYKNYEELKEEVRYREWLSSNGKLPFPEGEAEEKFIARVEKGWQNVLCQMEKEDLETAILVVHGGTIMALLSAGSKNEFYDYQAANGRGFLCNVNEERGKRCYLEARI
ncbi:MAG: bifunctional adenosylcobinamide kinase/adenosylcobinamide-phosphate guanylyltransferase [Lachnospiraceae bacterium]|nr:bifunctional adenosylcobinamide kinase/adenosylcobinamide-phosphate guanylyltransferase [Lachnospiraceae bacterium]